MQFLKKILGGLVVVGIFFGVKFYNKSESQKEIKAQVVKLCGDDQVCLKSVDKHYNACFETAYKIGSRRRSASFDDSKFFNCINSKEGKTIFTMAPANSNQKI